MPSKISAVIVDDEPPARKFLRSMLASHPEILVAGEAGDVQSAAELCNRVKPNLVFLDIQLPRLDGFALLPLLESSPEIVFVTAFDRYAVRAFQVNAMDYLLKPIAPDRLASTVSRLAKRRPDIAETLLDTDLVALREDSQLRMVPVKTLTHIKAEDNYTSVHLKDGSTALVRRTLGEWKALLPADFFLRVDRSLIVRLDAISELKTVSRDLSEVFFLGSNASVRLGRKASLRLRKAIGA